jgi:hypothetical protein
LLILFVTTRAHAQTVTDEKLWTSATAAADLTDVLRLSLSEELRLGADSGTDQARTGLQLDIRATDILRFAAGYTLILRDGNQRLGTRDETRHRLAGDMNLVLRFDRLSLSDRVRLQFTTYEYEEAHVHLRNRLRAGVAATKHVEPYVAVELIYLLSPKSEYRETRFYVGVDWRAMKRFDVGGFFLYQVETNVNMPEENFILGLELSYLFRKVKKPATPGADDEADRDRSVGHD